MTTPTTTPATDAAADGLIEVGDTVTAQFLDHRNGGPYTITGTAYRVDRFPTNLWVGGEILIYHGELAATVVAAIVTTPGQPPRVLSGERDW